MASFRQRLSSLGGGGGPSDAATQQEADKYKLMVTAGPSYNQEEHRLVSVNADDAVYLENDFVRAKVKVRVREYRGLPSTSQYHSAYFDDPIHEKDMYSVAFSFVPKQDLPSVDTVWGNDFDHPVRDRLPPGFNTAFRIVKEFIDPGLSCDAYADEPWLYGPSLSCWFAFRIGDTVRDDQDFPAPSEQPAMREGGDGSGKEVRQQLGLPENNEKRRKHFLSASNRETMTFEKGRVYQADFYNPFIDFSNFSLKLPGFSLKVIKYVDQKSHNLRYVFKNVESGGVYLNINFHLLWGQKLEDEKARDRQRQQTGSAEQNSNSIEANGGQPYQVNGGSVSHIESGDTGVADARSKSVSEMPRNDESSSNPRSASAPGMQIHPGDHRASVESHPTSQWPAQAQIAGPNRAEEREHEAQDGVDEVAQLLQDTSTDDRRGSKVL